MLRGNYTARIDSKGRLKVPTLFRRYVEEKYGAALYVTSLTGDCVRIYPMPEWEAIEQRLSLLPSMDPARRKFLDRTNYYGQQSSMDTQGRVLIHPLLRKSAQVVGDVAVLGFDIPGSLGAGQVPAAFALGSVYRGGRGGDCATGYLKRVSSKQ